MRKSIAALLLSAVLVLSGCVTTRMNNVDKQPEQFKFFEEHTEEQETFTVKFINKSLYTRILIIVEEIGLEGGTEDFHRIILYPEWEADKYPEKMSEVTIKLKRISYSFSFAALYDDGWWHREIREFIQHVYWPLGESEESYHEITFDYTDWLEV